VPLDLTLLFGEFQRRTPRLPRWPAHIILQTPADYGKAPRTHGERIFGRCFAHRHRSSTPGWAHGSREQKINSAFLTNRRTHIYDSYPEERLPSGRILHYGLVLSAVKKCWATGSALSLKMFITLSAGISLWVFYGFLKSDFVIIIANAVSLGLLMGILYFKLRDRPSPA
jgi:MtN3 and saliva related transmembrane protein